MKKAFLGIIMLAFMLTASANCFAQKRTSLYTKSISADPVSLMFGILNATYEQKLDGDNSFTIFGSYWSLSDWHAYGIGGSYRWYFPGTINDKKKPLEGLSAGPAISVSYWSYDHNGFNSSALFLVGGELAYKFVLDGFVIEPALRFNFNVNSFEGYSYNRNFTIGVNLGYAWN